METKKCSRCEEEKSLSEFLFRNKEKGTYHSACRVCYKEIRKKSYEKHKETDRARANRNKRKRKEWFRELKSKLKCERCPENHPACLEFHHLDPSEKNNHVSSMVHETYSEKRILEEIDKCIVLCANCHRKEHHE